jgi:hypothetical protein
MRRFTIPLVVAAVLALSLATVGQSGAQSGGLSPSQLNEHGWTCFDVDPEGPIALGVHCSPPGQPWPPTKPRQQLLYFFNTTDPESTEPDFTGTESLVRDSHFHGQPCPTEGGEYTDLTFLGLPDYWGCHRR